MKTSNRGASVLGTIGDLGVEQFFLNPELNEIGNSFTSLIKDKTEINKQFYDALPDSLKKDPLEEMTNKIGLSNSLDLSLSLTHKWNAAGAAEGWTIGFEIAETKGLEIDAGIVKFEAERSKRLMKIEYNFGSKEWEADILGIKK